MAKAKQKPNRCPRLTKRQACRYLRGHVGACDQGMAFARRHASARDAWIKCDRPGWMLYVLYRTLAYDVFSNIREVVVSGGHAWHFSDDSRDADAARLIRKLVAYRDVAKVANRILQSHS